MTFQYCKCGVKSVCFPPKTTTDTKLLVPFWLSVLFCRQFCNPIAPQCGGGIEKCCRQPFCLSWKFFKAFEFCNEVAM